MPGGRREDRKVAKGVRGERGIDMRKPPGRDMTHNREMQGIHAGSAGKKEETGSGTVQQQSNERGSAGRRS
jgi:hypothetical protein